MEGSAVQPDEIGNLFYSLSRALQEPRTWDGELPGLLGQALARGQDPLPHFSIELEREASAALLDRERLEVEHARLFLGPFHINVSPWASLYLENDRMLMGETSLFVAKCYAEAGLAPAETVFEAPDHIVHEFEFMYYLAFKEAETCDCRWRCRQEAFWKNHLGRWLERFADALAEATTHSFYRHLSRVLSVLCHCLNEGYRWLPSPRVASSSLIRKLPSPHSVVARGPDT